MTNPVHTMVKRYMKDILPFLSKDATRMRDIVSFNEMECLNRRINRMWHNGLMSAGTTEVQYVRCASIPNVIRVKLQAKNGMAVLTDESIDSFHLLMPALHAFKFNAVRWVFVPLAVYWDPSIPTETPSDHVLCLLVVDNFDMTYDTFDAISGVRLIHIRDIYQPNHTLVIPLHTALQCKNCKSLFVDYSPISTANHSYMRTLGITFQSQGVALLFLTMACCLRYQCGHPWNVADAILSNAISTGIPKCLINWLFCLLECASWKEVSIVVGILKKREEERSPPVPSTNVATSSNSDSNLATSSNSNTIVIASSHSNTIVTDSSNYCGVLLNGDCNQPCMKKYCIHQMNTHHHVYCPIHRFALILLKWSPLTSPDIWRYMSDDVWSVKPDALPVGYNDGMREDIEKDRTTPNTDICVNPYPFVRPHSNPNRTPNAPDLLNQNNKKRKNNDMALVTVPVNPIHYNNR
jgi:hypothetical protein